MEKTRRVYEAVNAPSDPQAYELLLLLPRVLLFVCSCLCVRACVCMCECARAYACVARAFVFARCFVFACVCAYYKWNRNYENSMFAAPRGEAGNGSPWFELLEILSTSASPGLLLSFSDRLFMSQCLPQ